jgi:6-phosphogluconolactonase
MPFCRLSALILASALFANKSVAADAAFYIGTYSGPASEGIYRATLELETGAISKPALAVRAKNASFVAVSHDGGRLFAALEGAGIGIASYTVKPDGLLTLVSEASTGGAGNAFVGTTISGSHVFAANYGGGSVASFAVDQAGALVKRSYFQHSGAGPNTARQSQAHAHGCTVSPDGKRVYFADLGIDRLKAYKLLPDGAMEPDPAADGVTPPGGGPRHVVFHPNGKFLYANNELTSSVSAYSCDPASGALKEISTLSTLPVESSVVGNSTAEIVIHPSGKYLYVSNRGHNSVAVYAVDASSGLLHLLEIEPVNVDTPRGMGLSPDGGWLIVAGQKSDDLISLKVDAATGKLDATVHKAKLGKPVAIAFLPYR